jgi:SnoaL-like domain
MNTTSIFIIGGLVVLTAGIMAGCASAPASLAPARFTAEALAATEPLKATNAPTDVIERFKSVNSDFSTNHLAAHLTEIYAPEVWFRDPFKEVHGLPAMRAYILKSAAQVAEYSIDWQAMAVQEGDYYFRWVMTLKMTMESKKVPASKYNGITHVRFGADGKVIFQQDYFDGAAFLYEKIPFIGGGIRMVKRGI